MVHGRDRHAVGGAWSGPQARQITPCREVGVGFRADNGARAGWKARATVMEDAIRGINTRRRAG